MLRRPGLLLFMLCIFFYTIIQYGGIRAPDAEVVFRVGENLADGNGFGVTSNLENWKDFGVAYGKDSVLYSVYPPGESVALVPFILTARWINQTGWYENISIPLSHYVNDGFRKTFYRKPETNLEPHALRFLCSAFNILAASFGVLIFYGILFVTTHSRLASLFVSLLYAFGTIVWNYAGTFFSEPLTLVWVLSSFYFLVRSDPQFIGSRRISISNHLSISGILLGLALVTHTNSMMLAPFFAFYAWRLSGKKRMTFLWFAAGFLIFVLLLGYYNLFRFGNFLETGRGLSAHNPVDFVFPTSLLYWKNLFGLLVGYGKGLFLFCPSVLAGILTWNSLHKKHPSLSMALLAMIGLVTLMAASYQYWHAGFCLGPRYLMTIIPFMLIPVAFWVKENIEINRNGIAMKLYIGVLCLAAAQQLYFGIGELFSFYHVQKWTYIAKGVDIFLNDRIYMNWKFSPLHQLLTFDRGPFILQSIPLSNQVLWVCVSLLTTMTLVVTTFFCYKKVFSKPLQNKNAPSTVVNEASDN
ncbi:hypothetical protein JNM05_07420 [bacterium]|nr:hypothetical protein [bacterium]